MGALLTSRIAPSKQLLAVAADEVQRWEMFVLFDEQPQIHELLSPARVQDIERYAAVLGIEVEEIRLDDQVRCGGSQVVSSPSHLTRATGVRH